jgi:hypothetical protein
MSLRVLTESPGRRNFSTESKGKIIRIHLHPMILPSMILPWCSVPAAAIPPLRTPLVRV